MSIIYTETKSDKDSRIEIDIGDGRKMTINITGEGIIMDVFGPPDEDSQRNRSWLAPDIILDPHLGSAGMTFEEWADWVQRDHDERHGAVKYSD